MSINSIGKNAFPAILRPVSFAALMLAFFFSFTSVKAQTSYDPTDIDYSQGGGQVEIMSTYVMNANETYVELVAPYDPEVLRFTEASSSVQLTGSAFSTVVSYNATLYHNVDQDYRVFVTITSGYLDDTGEIESRIIIIEEVDE